MIQHSCDFFPMGNFFSNSLNHTFRLKNLNIFLYLLDHLLVFWHLLPTLVVLQMCLLRKDEFQKRIQRLPEVKLIQKSEKKSNFLSFEVIASVMFHDNPKWSWALLHRFVPKKIVSNCRRITELCSGTDIALLTRFSK